MGLVLLRSLSRNVQELFPIQFSQSQFRAKTSKVLQRAPLVQKPGGQLLRYYLRSFPVFCRTHLHQKGSAVYYDGLACAVPLLHEEKIGARNLAGFAHPAHEQLIAQVLVHGFPILLLHVLPKIRSHDTR